MNHTDHFARLSPHAEKVQRRSTHTLFSDVITPLWNEEIIPYAFSVTLKNLAQHDARHFLIDKALRDYCESLNNFRIAKADNDPDVAELGKSVALYHDRLGGYIREQVERAYPFLNPAFIANTIFASIDKKMDLRAQAQSQASCAAR